MNYSMLIINIIALLIIDISIEARVHTDNIINLINTVSPILNSIRLTAILLSFDI